MNIDFVKEKIAKNIGKNVKIVVYGMRNRVNFYEGVIYKIYPNIFTILCNNFEKSFSYRDIITKDISINYK